MSPKDGSHSLVLIGHKYLIDRKDWRRLIEAIEILEQCMTAYSELDTFFEVGTIIDSDVSGQRRVAQEFRTLYRKPNLFRYEFGPPNDRGVVSYPTRFRVGFEGNRSYLVSQGIGDAHPTIRYENDFSLIIAASTGLSLGGSGMIASLLFPSQEGFKLRKIWGAQFISESTKSDAPCWEIFGNYPGTRGVKLAISRSDSLLQVFEWKGPISSDWITHKRTSINPTVLVPEDEFKIDLTEPWFMNELGK